MNIGVQICRYFIRSCAELIWHYLFKERASLVAQMVKNLPAMQETWVQSLGQEKPPEKGMATHSNIFAWRVSWTERSLVGYSSWGHKESDTIERPSLSSHSVVSDSLQTPWTI